jgi:hypothetical protein
VSTGHSQNEVAPDRAIELVFQMGQPVRRPHDWRSLAHRGIGNAHAIRGGRVLNMLFHRRADVHFERPATIASLDCAVCDPCLASARSKKFRRYAFDQGFGAARAKRTIAKNSNGTEMLLLSRCRRFSNRDGPLAVADRTPPAAHGNAGSVLAARHGLPNPQ